MIRILTAYTPTGVNVNGRVERLCAHLAADDFARLAAAYGVAEPLARVLEAVRTGAEPAALERDLDAVGDAFATHGQAGVTSGTRAYSRPPGMPGHPVVRLWVCPAPRRCPRARMAGAAPAPVCAITGRPLDEIDVTG